jgi:hypothetical protein
MVQKEIGSYMKPITVLKKVYKLLSNPARWTRGAFARNNMGYPVSPNDKHACRFCLDGALKYVTGDFFYVYNSSFYLLNSIAPIFDTNDIGGRQAVLRLLRKGIRACQQSN